MWIIALFLLYNISPEGEHLSMCPLYNLGFDFCPGCGIGRSIFHVLHFDFIESFSQHFLGVFALTMILYRIFNLTIIPLFKNKIKLT